MRTRREVLKELGGVVLSDGDSAPLWLAALWQEPPVVLVFMRHFG